MKKTFVCGHSGKGKFCHRCANDASEAEKIRQAKARAKQTKQVLVESDPIDLSALSHLPALQSKARSILSALANGADHRTFRGKGVNSTENEIISIPVGNSHRMLYRRTPFEPIALYTHEDYNNILGRLNEKHG